MHFLSGLISHVRIFLCYPAFVWAIVASGQILDDSTKQVYGPKTTAFIHAENILNNELTYRKVDTSIYRFEKQTFRERLNWKFQNLGNLGTALFDSYYTPQMSIGNTSGYNAFTKYRMMPGQIKFYDTKSPFIELGTFLGGNNRNKVTFGFSQNIKPHWNFGFNIRILTSDKIIARESRTDRQTGSNAYTIYSHFKHPKMPYQALASYSLLKHKIVENGGVRYRSEDRLLNELFQYRNTNTRLFEAENLTKFNTLFFYHDYRIAEQFQVYHSLDLTDETHTFTDFDDGGPDAGGYDTYGLLDTTALAFANGFYPPDFLINQDSTQDRALFDESTNELGIKGDFADLFYRAYVKLRVVDFNYAFLNPTKRIVEEYLGGYARFTWKDKFAIAASGEYLLGAGYKFNANVESGSINLSYRLIKYTVPLMYQRYFGNHYEWTNDFDPIFANTLTGDISLKWNRFEFVPKATICSYGNYVYFNSNRIPEQINGTTLLTTLGGEVNTQFFVNEKGHGLYLENEILLSTSSGTSAEVFRMPPLLYNGRWFYRGKIFEGKVPVEIGTGITARSAYFANAYDPVTQQFYVQDEQDIFGYYRTDLFYNMRLNNFFFSVKWNYFNQPGDSGYFSTPWHPSEPRSIDLIVRWLFFD